MLDKYLYTRREFLRNMTVAGVGIAALPAFLTDTLAQSTISSNTPNDQGPIIVVVQLGGGNDGLNTVVPHLNDHYRRARGRLALPSNSLLSLNDELALHSAMQPMMDLLQEGKLAVINGVGYPNPDRSHFRSMEIWHTAVDSDRSSSTGWIGKYFDSQCPQCAPAAAVHIGGQTPQAFSGRSGVGVAFTDPDRFQWQGSQRGNTRQAFQALNPSADSGTGNLDFLRQVTTNAVASSTDVLRASRTARKAPEYPDSQLGRSLRTIATLIAGGLSTRIYYTSISGFDTHALQADTHAGLLRQFSNAASAFWKGVEAIGASDRVTVMCFSEFGRRVAANASSGTDHGTAGPMFLLGAGVRPGLHGVYPSLAPGDLDDGDLRHSVDFRAIYSEILSKRLGADPAGVLGRPFPEVGVIRA